MAAVTGSDDVEVCRGAGAQPGDGKAGTVEPPKIWPAGRCSPRRFSAASTQTHIAQRIAEAAPGRTGARPGAPGAHPPGKDIMTMSKARVFYYNGIMWRTVVMADGTRVTEPLRLIDGALAARPVKRT